jgi:predicted ATPase
MLRGEAEQLARLAGASGELIGRARDKAALTALILGTRMVTVTGLPGVGKTAVAVAAAASTIRAFPDGVWPVPLGQLRDEELVAHTVAHALAIPDRLSPDRLSPDQLSRSRLDGLANELRGRRMLLVLDTCEHLTRGCADLSATVLRQCPYIRILATSREPLRLPEERVCTVRPLTLGHAVVLFGKRVKDVDERFRVTPENRPVVTEICRRLDRLPLAIELAARQLASMSLTELRNDLNTGVGLLHNGADAPRRHQTLSAAIGWSHQLCTPSERLLWARLSVFAEPFRLLDAQAVCADEYLPALPVADALLGLTSRSLLLTDDDDQPGTVYRTPETIRAYGSAMLLRLGEEASVHARYRQWQADRN